MSEARPKADRREFTVRRVARLVIQFTTPFRVGSGRGDVVSDADAVRDVNGLPFIPGSSLAGALRAQVALVDPDLAKSVFGHQTKDQGAGSRLTLSHGLLHNQHGTPVEGWLMPQATEDPVLADARGGELRDHVKITHQGVADSDKNAKFDERLVSAGHRFTFELELVDRDDPACEAGWLRLLAALQAEDFRLGGGSRRGLGVFKVVPELCRQRSFRLTDDDDRKAYVKHSPRLVAAPAALNAVWPKSENEENKVLLSRKLQLSPSGYWLIGGGTDNSEKRPAGKAPVRTSIIVWPDAGAAEVKPDCLVIPGSGLKGALAHRTTFHYNRLKKKFADEVENIEEFTGENNQAVRLLFGQALDGSKGRRGAVLISDLILPPERPNQRVDHVAIDRFTGGALGTALYDERVLWQGAPLPEIIVTVTAAAQAASVQDKDAPEAITDALAAFNAALDDLAAGRLALGAGASRGYGFFEESPAQPPDPVP